MPAVPAPPQAEALNLPDLGSLDKSEDSDEVDVGGFELSLVDDDEEQPGEVSTDLFEVDIQVLTDPGSNEAAADLDVGVDDMLETLPEAARDRDSDAPTPGNAELDMHLDMPLESDDPSSDAELGDDGLEALPELLNEEGDGDAGPDVERTFLPSAPEGAISRAASYESEWLLLGTPATALAAGADFVLGAAEQLMHFGQDRKSQSLPVGVRVSSLVQLTTSSVLMATTRGLLEVSPSGAPTFTEAPEQARGSGSDVVELAIAGAGSANGLWARLANGVVLRRRAGAWERHDAGGQVRALTSFAEHVSLLVISSRPTLQLSSDSGSSFRELLLPEPAATVALGAAPTLVSRGQLIALADSERGLCVSSDGGASFRMVTGAVNVTAIALGEHAGAASVFAALHREGKDLTELIAVAPRTGYAVSIGELSGEPDEDAEETGHTQALLFAHGYLWCAGGYGLARLRA